LKPLREGEKRSNFAWNVLGNGVLLDGVKRDFSLKNLKKKESQARSSNSSNGTSITSKPLHKKRD
jgi:hypothetical protein